MSELEFSGIVLAAGQSTRMVTFNKLTALIGGRPLVSYPVKHLRAAGAKQIVVVVGHDRDSVTQAVAVAGDVTLALQEKQLGTGHAALQAVEKLVGSPNIVVIFGDCPFLDAHVIQEVVAHHNNSKAFLTIATSRIRNASAWGRISRSSTGEIVKVIDGRQEPSGEEETEVFVGLSVWRFEALAELLPLLTPVTLRDGQDEQNLPDVIELAIKRGKKVEIFAKVDALDATAPNTPREFLAAGAYVRTKKTEQLMLDGIQFDDPNSAIVDYDVIVGRGSKIARNVQLLGATSVGEDCRVGPDATLRDCHVGTAAVVGRGAWTNVNFPRNARAYDRLAGDHRYFSTPHYLTVEEPKLCFGILPETYRALFANLIWPTVTRHGYRYEIADLPRLGSISNQIWEGINRASLIIAEITEDNANVWFEVGLAFAMNKQVIMFSRNDRKLPFDVQHFRVILYDPGTGDLTPKLEQLLDELDARKVP